MKKILLGLIAVVMATLGDLCESVIKRDLGSKDMSQVIPDKPLRVVVWSTGTIGRHAIAGLDEQDPPPQSGARRQGHLAHADCSHIRRSRASPAAVGVPSARTRAMPPSG